MQSGEWTEVTSKGKKKKKEREPTAPRIKPQNAPSRTVTLAQMQADFNGKMRIWQACECRKTTLSTLDRIRPEHGWRMRQAVCVGSGSFSRDNLECRRRSMWQLVVFVDLTRELQGWTEGGSEVKMFAQEPEYTDIDGSLLSTMRVKILEVAKTINNEAESAVEDSTCAATVGLGLSKEYLDSATFLYEPFMDMNAQMVREISDADPALYIGSSMRGLLTNRSEVGNLAKRFDQEHEKYQLPRFKEDPNVLEGLCIYWKPEMHDGN